MDATTPTNTTARESIKESDEQQRQQLPVIIAGAGPCGLTTALTLQKHAIPFVLYERSSLQKLCSNAGSGIDMAPTAVDILETQLNVNMDKAMRPYDYMWNGDTAGRHVSTYRFKDMQLPRTSKIPDTRNFGFAGRADLQRALLDALGISEETKSDLLHCGISVTEYTQNDNHVAVSLSNGTVVHGSALLACDGIHSAIRKHMYRHGVEDSLQYCGQECWWGKTTVQPGSKLDLELKTMEKTHSMEDGNVALTLVGTHECPGGFFSCEIEKHVHAWVWFVANKTPPTANATNDLTRRGGSVLTPAEKRQELAEQVANRADLLRYFIDETPAEDITRAGLFDRKNLDLPYVDGRVALLGDAAHPQSPMMGQGANMAIVDGYVIASRLAAANMDNIAEAFQQYDSKTRRKSNNVVIKQARKYGKYMASESRFTCWAMRLVIQYLSPKAVMSELMKGDKSNEDFLAAMNEDLAATVSS